MKTGPLGPRKREKKIPHLPKKKKKNEKSRRFNLRKKETILNRAGRIRVLKRYNPAQLSTLILPFLGVACRVAKNKRIVLLSSSPTPRASHHSSTIPPYETQNSL